MKRVVAVCGTLACLACFGWIAAETRTSVVDAPSFELNSPPSAPTAWRSWLSGLARREAGRMVLLQAGADWLALPRSALGLSLDESASLTLLSHHGRRPGPLEYLTRLLNIDVRPPTLDLPLVWRFDSETARQTLLDLSLHLDAPPRDAKLDFGRRALEWEHEGRHLDVERSLELLRQASPNLSDVAELAFRTVPPNVRLSELPPVDPRKLLATFQTDFSRKTGPRVHNIRQAARYLDGTVLAPGATFSFNRRVGHRVPSRGFIDAPVIVNDEMESGMGGGVCQVATTLHAAAIYGGLEVTERRSHSRPSGYAPLGLDATVIDGIQDLKLRNPYPVHLYVRAYLPSRYVVRVEIFGAELGGEVKHSNWVLKRHSFTRRVVVKPELATGSVEISQKGSFGYDTVSLVSLAQTNGERLERRYASKYYPVPEVLWVGPGTPSSALPPLPDGSAGGTVADQAL